MAGVAVPNDHALAKDDTTPIVVMVPGLTSDSASPVRILFLYLYLRRRMAGSHFAFYVVLK